MIRAHTTYIGVQQVKDLLRGVRINIFMQAMNEQAATYKLVLHRID
jgi:hypothetical protein